MSASRVAGARNCGSQTSSPSESLMTNVCGDLDGATLTNGEQRGGFQV
jgi:hypothetical protein